MTLPAKLCKILISQPQSLEIQHTFVVYYQWLSLTIESHWMTALQRVRSESALYLNNIEQIPHSKLRIFHFNQRIFEYCSKTFIEPNVIPPLASDNVSYKWHIRVEKFSWIIEIITPTKKLMTQLMGYNSQAVESFPWMRRFLQNQILLFVCDETPVLHCSCSKVWNCRRKHLRKFICIFRPQFKLLKELNGMLQGVFGSSNLILTSVNSLSET